MEARSMFLTLLLAALAYAGPSPVQLVNPDMEVLLPTLDTNQEKDVSAAWQDLNGNKPLKVTDLPPLSEKSEFEVANDAGKQASGLPLVSPLPKDCGRNPRYEISGGREDNAPWLIAMGRGRGKDFRVECVGVIISRRHVLAPPLCLFANKVDAVLAPMGNEVKIIELLGISTVPDVQKPEDLLAGRNIAVATLKIPITFSEKVQPACLPGLFATINPEGRILNATVYGFAAENGGLEKFFGTVNSYGPVVFYKFLKDFNAKYPREQVKSIELISKNHLGVVADFKTLRYSALLFRNVEDGGRFYLLGIGPVASDINEPVTLYTSTIPHRHWIEVVVRQ
ncbi:uncharacterized protein LOC143024964 [Oratosquilla oratoria]|uniref:uncharacterized protein LOC143024964 n=1 Tax=Oratosquilla oratoria TaxID=337810 RepID=UPI003F7639AC